jgi:hypothetical protein
MFPIGRLTLGVTFIMLILVFMVEGRRMRGYVKFFGGLLLFSLTWYFIVELYEAEEWANIQLEGPQPMTVTVLPGSALLVAVIATLLIMYAGWRVVGSHMAERVPGIMAEAKVRNLLVIAITVFVLLEGINSVFGVGGPVVSGTSVSPSTGAVNDTGDATTMTPTPTPEWTTLTPTVSENPYVVTDVPDYYIEDDDDVYGGVYVGGGCGNDGDPSYDEDDDADNDGNCAE